MKGSLEFDPRYTVVPIPAADAPDKSFQPLESMGDIFRTEKIEPEAEKFLKALGAKLHVDVIIVIKSFRGPSAFEIDKHPFLLEGYGLFTKKFFISKKAYAYANIAAIVFRTDPVKYIGSGRPKNMASPLGDFDLSGDLKNLTHYEIAKLEWIMRKYADQAIENALNDANLIIN